MAGLAVYLFGTPRIERDGVAMTVERRKSLALLAYLAAAPQPHGREALATLLWPDFDSERARAGLRRALVDLNASLGKGWVEVEGDQVALRGGPELRVDVGHFRAALAQVAAHSHPRFRPCDACLALLAEAVNLYTADFLAGFTLADAVEFDAWQTFQTESLRLELATALEQLACGLAGRQQYDAALPHARRWLALDPLHEPAHRLLMQLYAWAGDRAAVARQYRECSKVLQAELGVEPEPETTALYESLVQGREGAGERGSKGAGALPAVPAAPHNLPLDLTPFVGRETELAQIAQRLADPACRLLTVLGPGGMGKTRLAVQAARVATENFAHGVFFADLAPVAAADFLPAAIMRALPLAPSGADAQAQLAGFLRDKHLLLVLDNFEHLVAGSDLLSALLRAAPKLKLLATSRVRLNLREEWLAPLEGLEVPGDSDHEARSARSDAQEPSRSSRFADFAPLRDFAIQTTATLEHYSATALFLACVRRLRPDFQPTAADAGPIVHICRLLDGIPLAIELAAAWHRSLPLNEVARELERGLSLLATKARDVPERQRSMTATFDYSWQLLSSHERSILRQASVFRGGFTRDAAVAVTGASLADLGSLTDASWISPRASGRYELHELTHQYCAEKLETEHQGDTGEAVGQVRDRHATYYRALLLARQGEFGLRSGALTEIAAEHGNLSAAWDWFVATDGLDEVRTMILGLYWIAFRYGWGRAFMQLLEACALKLKEGAAARAHVPDRGDERVLVQATLLAALLDGVNLVSRESWDAWIREATSLLAQGETDDERWREMRWLLRYRLAQGHRTWGNYAEAVALFRTLLPELDEGRFRPWPYTDDARYRWQIDGRMQLGRSMLCLGEYAEAQRLAEQSIALAKQIGAEGLRWECDGLRAEALIYADDCREAEKTARELLRAFRAVGASVGVAWAFWIMGQALAGLGSYVRARACFRRTLAFARETGDLLIESLHHLGNVELVLGNLAEARRLYGELISLCEGRGLSYGVVVGLTGLARVALVADDLAGAKEHLLRALKTQPRSRPIQHTIEAIAALAEIEQAEGQWEAAVELCAALLSWPSTPHYAPETLQHLRLELEMRLRQLEVQLPPEVFAAAVARGRARQVADVVAEIVGDQR